MDISKYTKAPGIFLKAEDVKDHPETVWLIKEAGNLVTSEKFGNERLHVPVASDNDTKTFDMSKTNARAVEAVLGNDTTKWVGHGLILEIYKTKTSDGRMTDAINVKEVKKLIG